MRITERQVRQLVRKVLHEGRRANSWETYITITSEDHDIPEPEVAAMVDQYKAMISRIKSQKESPDDTVVNYIVNEFKLFPNQSDSYKDWVKWYMRYNASPNGRLLAAGKKWLDVEDVLAGVNDAYEMLISQRDVADSVAVADVTDAADDTTADPKVRKQRFKKWAAKRIEKAKSRAANRRERRAARRKARKLNRNPEPKKQDKRTDGISRDSASFKAADLNSDGTLTNSELRKWQSGGGKDEFEK